MSVQGCEQSGAAGTKNQNIGFAFLYHCGAS
jgi:hypothetical protein